MTTFAQDIEQAFDLTPHTVVIGDNPWFTWDDDDPKPPRWVDEVFLHVPLPWDEARPLLDYNYNDGFGGEDCHPVYVWSDTEVGAVHEYDGATWVNVLPLVPVPCTPSTI